MYLNSGNNETCCWLCLDECCESKKEVKAASEIRQTRMELLFTETGLMVRGAGLEEGTGSSLFLDTLGS